MLFFFTLENKKSETIYNRGLKNGNTLQKMSQPEESCSSRQEYSSSIFGRRMGKIMEVKKNWVEHERWSEERVITRCASRGLGRACRWSRWLEPEIPHDTSTRPTHASTTLLIGGARFSSLFFFILVGEQGFSSRFLNFPCLEYERDSTGNRFRWVTA